jgi:glycosyltransferase involved in cell wall biosynthesis
LNGGGSPVPRVIIVPHGFQPEYEAGFANGLARNGWSVALIGSDMSLLTRLDEGVQLLNLRGSQDGGRPAWTKALNLLAYWIRLYGYLLRHRGTPVHVIGEFSTADLRVSVIESWLTRMTAGRYVLTVHNPTRDIAADEGRQRARDLRLRRAIYVAAEVCVVHTPRLRATLAESFGIDPARIVVVEHGIDRLLPSTPASRDAMRDRLGATEEEKLLLFFGNLARYKGLDILLQAFDQVAARLPVRLAIAGRCVDRELRAEVSRHIAASPNRAAIRWLDGYVPDDEVPSVFHAADLLVLPYRAIDQSGVVFMALATGVPIVASDVGSLRDYVPPEVGAVVPPSDVNALTAAIESVLGRTRPNGIARTTATRHLWSSTVQPVLPVYRRIARRG